MTVNKQTGEIIEGEEFSEGRLIGLLVAFYELKRNKTDAERKYATATKPLRAYLEEHGGDLVDGENRIRAFLQERTGGKQPDWKNLPESLLRFLADTGCLRFDYAQFKKLHEAQMKGALDVDRFLMPAPGTVALQIVKEDK